MPWLRFGRALNFPTLAPFPSYDDARRGKPLYLDRASYRQLSSLWASSALEFDSHMLHNSRVDLPFL